MEHPQKLKPRAAQSLWLEFSKENYREHMKKICELTKDEIKFNTREHAGAISAKVIVVKVSTWLHSSNLAMNFLKPYNVNYYSI